MFTPGAFSKNRQQNPFGDNTVFQSSPEQQQKKEEFQKSMKSFRRYLLLAVVVLAVLILSQQCFYTVDQTEHAIRYRFNEIIAVDVNNLTDEEYQDLIQDPGMEQIQISNSAGIKIKMPFLDRVEKMNNRLITYDTMPREVITSDKKKMILDNNAQWWIVNPVKFKITMKNITSANQRIEDLMYSKMNEKIGLTTANELISDKEKVAIMLKENANELNQVLSTYGIKVADIQIKRTDFPAENNENIFNRMRTEREQMARQYRSEGREEAEKIRSTAERDAAKLRAEANAEAQRIRGKGDADAAAIFNAVYNEDPEFFRFYKALETYRVTLPNSGAKIVIGPDSEFAKYLYNIQ